VELNNYIKEVSTQDMAYWGYNKKMVCATEEKYGVRVDSRQPRKLFSGDMVAYLRPLVELVSDAINLADGMLTFRIPTQHGGYWSLPRQNGMT